VISNRSKAYGLTRCAESSPPIPTSVLNLKTYLASQPAPGAPSPRTRETYDQELAQLVLSTKPDLIILAGFMHILSPSFLAPLEKTPIINLHPALPGAFDGANAIPRALEAFEKGEVEGTGVMVHRVVEAVDQGEPILVRKIEIVKGEGLEALEDRIHKVEHEIIVEGARKVLQEMGRI
jgi:phosphoribosylglycinamide formyltransferase